MMNLPHEMTSLIVSFLPGKELLALSSTCSSMWRLVDDPHEDHLWKRVVQSEMGERAPYREECRSTYHLDWRALYLDNNQRNHTFVFKFPIPHYRDRDERLYSNWILPETDYAFRLIVDPMGNQLAGIPLGSAMSVYLECRPEPKRTHWSCVVESRISVISFRKLETRTISWCSETKRFEPGMSSWGVHSLVPRSVLIANNSPFVSNESLIIRCRFRLPHVRVAIAGTSTVLDCPLGWSLQDIRQITLSTSLWWYGDPLPVRPITREEETRSLQEWCGYDGCYASTMTLWPESAGILVRGDGDTEWVQSSLRLDSIPTIWSYAEIYAEIHDFGSLVLVEVHVPPEECRQRIQERVERIGQIDREWALNLCTRFLPDPPHRIRRVFQDHPSVHQTLRYLLQKRHLGYICDGCGQYEFTGTRYHCTVCNDYDHCETCLQQSFQTPLKHRYTIDRKRIFPYDLHTTGHEMVPVLR